jgi:hypothetical protein
MFHDDDSEYSSFGSSLLAADPDRDSTSASEYSVMGLENVIIRYMSLAWFFSEHDVAINVYVKSWARSGRVDVIGRRRDRRAYDMVIKKHVKGRA